MKKYGIVLTENYKPIKVLRFTTEKEANTAYLRHKADGYGVIKIRIDKAHELQTVNFKNVPDTYQIGLLEK